MAKTPVATERQQKWFASVRDGILRDTGQTVEAWAELVRTTCPESTPRARQAWLKATHGLGQNRAMTILQLAFPDTALGWDEPDALLAALWTTPESMAIFAAVQAAVSGWEAVTVTPRKQFVGFSRAVQFAALAPVKGGGARLGLALPMEDGLVAPRAKEPWSERLKSVCVLETEKAVNRRVKALLKRAYDGS